MANPEGAVSSKVTDSAKFQCHLCNSTRVQVSTLADEPEDITDDAAWWATIAVENATKRTCLYGLCHCGKHQIIKVELWDTYTFTGAETTPAGTNLDATTANGLAGWFFIATTGTDKGKYVEISSNTEAAPTVLTLAFAMTDDTDGECIITNIEPIGLTKIVA